MAGEEENVELLVNNQTESQSNDEVVVENPNGPLESENIGSIIPDISQSEKQNETTNQAEERVIEDVNEKLRQETSTHDRLIKLPLSRIKIIMKSDPDVTLASQEAVITLAKATELFIAMLSKDAVVSTLNSKRKTLQRKDLDNVLDTRDGYEFLEGTLD